MNGSLGIDFRTLWAAKGELGPRAERTTACWQVFECAIRLPLQVFTHRHTLTSLDLTCGHRMPACIL